MKRHNPNLNEPPVARKNLFLVLIGIFVGVLIGVGLNGPVTHLAIRVFSGPEAHAETKSTTTPGSSILKKTSDSFRSVVQKVGPAVVSIRVTRGGHPHSHHAREQGHPNMPPNQPGFPPDFFDFFRNFGSPFQMPQEQEQTVLGTGIIIDKRGYIVTNNHVVEEGNDILVTLNGRDTEVKAKVVGTDPMTDLAVIKLDDSVKVPGVATWADINTVDVGDWAIAIGSPFALENTVTVGVVSAKGRPGRALIGTDYSGDLLQTDAAINPGNSGGPLCDLDGNVMGVNTAIYTRSGGYMGIGFAIPSNLAQEISSQLIASGKVTRGWLGVVIQPLDPELAKDLGVKQGVTIHEVTPDSPAAASGLKAGDVITEVNGKIVKSTNELQQTISALKPGEKVNLKVISYEDKKARTITVNIGKMPANLKGLKGQGSPSTNDKLGVVVRPSANGKGVVVDQVQADSLADQIGIQPGDVILRINRKPVNTVSEFNSLIKSTKNNIYLDVERDGRMLFFQFSIGE